MTAPRFNPNSAVTFDLERGRVRVSDDENRLMVGADALLGLCQAASPDAQRAFGEKLGTSAGARVKEVLGDEKASVESFVDHLGGHLALLGLGSLSLERWGRALVFRLSNVPFEAAGDELLCRVLEGALKAAVGRACVGVILERKNAEVSVLITAEQGAQRVQAWLKEGLSTAEALGRLHLGDAS